MGDQEQTDRVLIAAYGIRFPSFDLGFGSRPVGLRFKSIGGTDVFSEEKKAVKDHMRGCPHELDIVFHRVC